LKPRNGDRTSSLIATKHSYECVHRWPIRRRGATVDEDNVASSVQHHITAKLMEVRTGPVRQAPVPEASCIRHDRVTVEEPEECAATEPVSVVEPTGLIADHDEGEISEPVESP